MSDQIATTEARQLLVGARPEPAGDRVLARGEWWLGDPQPWQPAAVTVASDRLVFESARGMSDLTLANAIEDAGIERAKAAIAALRYLPPGLG